MSIVFFIVVCGATIVIFNLYMKLYNSHPYFLLDEDGVIKKERWTSFCNAYIHLDPNDFIDLKSLHLSYFPNGSFEATHTSDYSLNNTLRIQTSIKCNTTPYGTPCDEIFRVEFIVRKINDSPQTYYMYLFQRCNVGDHVLKGDFFKGSLSDLKYYFKSWEQRQYEFLKKHKQI